MCKERKEQTRRGCSPNILTQTEKAKALRVPIGIGFCCPTRGMLPAPEFSKIPDSRPSAQPPQELHLRWASAMASAFRQKRCWDGRRAYVRRTDVPVTADLEAGYGDAVENGRRVWDVGAVGINLEDVTGDEDRLRFRLTSTCRLSPP